MPKRVSVVRSPLSKSLGHGEQAFLEDIFGLGAPVGNSRLDVYVESCLEYTGGNKETPGTHHCDVPQVLRTLGRLLSSFCLSKPSYAFLLCYVHSLLVVGGMQLLHLGWNRSLTIPGIFRKDQICSERPIVPLGVTGNLRAPS